MQPERQLLTTPEVAALTGLTIRQLRRPSSRQRLEAQGFPAPHMGVPLKWSRPALMRWLDPEGAPWPAVPARDETETSRDAWRRRLADEQAEALEEA